MNGSSYTITCLLAGIGVSFFLLPAIYPMLDALLSLLGLYPGSHVPARSIVTETVPGKIDHVDIHVGKIIICLCLGLVGLTLLRLSFQLERTDEPNVGAEKLLKYAVLFFILMAASVFVVPLTPWFTDRGRESQIGALFYLIYSLISIVPLIYIGLLSDITFVWINFGLFIGGLFCLPRAYIFMTTHHKLNAVWEDRDHTGQFNAASVLGALGQKSTSAAEARKLRLDAEKLAREAAEEARRLREEKERLSKGIEDDIQRMKLEAELAKRMAEIDALRIQIETLGKYKR